MSDRPLFASPGWRLAAAQAVLNRPLPAAGLGDGFLVDPDRAAEAVKLLDKAVQDIRAAIVNFRRYKPVAPAQDPVSQNLSVQMWTMKERAITYYVDWAQQVEDTRHAIQAQIDAYRQADRANAERLA